MCDVYTALETIETVLNFSGILGVNEVLTQNMNGFRNQPVCCTVYGT